MTDAQKTTYVRTLIGNDSEATDALIAVYLSDAKAAIMRRLYRVIGEVPGYVEMPTIYDNLQCRLAQRYFLRRGAEAEISHNENGVNRSYGSVNDEDLLMEVMPFAKVM